MIANGVIVYEPSKCTVPWRFDVFILLL